MDPVNRLTETHTPSSLFSRFNKVSAVALAAIAVSVALAAVAILISMPLLFIPAAILTVIGGSILLVQCCFKRHIVSEDINGLSSCDEVASDAYDMAYDPERAPPPSYLDSDDDSEIASTAKTAKVPVRLGDVLDAAPVPIPVPSSVPSSPLLPFPIPASSPSPFAASLPLPPEYRPLDQTVNASITTRAGEVRIGDSRTTTVHVNEHYHNGSRVNADQKKGHHQEYIRL